MDLSNNGTHKAPRLERSLSNLEKTELLRALASFRPELGNVDSTPILWEQQNFHRWLELRKPEDPKEYLVLLEQEGAPIHFILKIAVHLNLGEDSSTLEFLIDRLPNHPEFDYLPQGGFGKLFEHLTKKLGEKTSRKKMAAIKETIAILATYDWEKSVNDNDKATLNRILKTLISKNYYPALRGRAKTLLTSDKTFDEGVSLLIQAHEHCPPGPHAQILENMIFDQLRKLKLSRPSLIAPWITKTRNYLNVGYYGISALWEDLKNNQIKLDDSFFSQEVIHHLNERLQSDDPSSSIIIRSILVRIHQSRNDFDAAKQLLLNQQIRDCHSFTYYFFEPLKELANTDLLLKRHLAWTILRCSFIRPSTSILVMAERSFRESENLEPSPLLPWENQANRTIFYKEWINHILTADSNYHDISQLAESIFHNYDLWSETLFPANQSRENYLRAFKLHVEVLKHVSKTEAPLSQNAERWIQTLENLFLDRSYNLYPSEQQLINDLIKTRKNLIHWILFKTYRARKDSPALADLLKKSTLLYDPTLSIDMRDELLEIALNHTEDRKWVFEKFAADLTPEAANSYLKWVRLPTLAQLFKQQLLKQTESLESNKRYLIHSISYLVSRDLYSLDDLVELYYYFRNSPQPETALITKLGIELLNRKSSSKITPELTREVVHTLREVCSSPYHISVKPYALFALFSLTDERFPRHWFTNLSPRFPKQAPAAQLQSFIRFCERCDSGDLREYVNFTTNGLKINIDRLAEPAPKTEDSSLDSAVFESEINQILDEITSEKYADLQEFFTKHLKGTDSDTYRKVGKYIRTTARQAQDFHPLTMIELLVLTNRLKSQLLMPQILDRLKGPLHREVSQLQSFDLDETSTDEEILDSIRQTIELARNEDRSSREENFFNKLRKYYTEQSDDGVKFRFFANHLLKLNPTEKKERVLIYFENLNTCGTGIAEANEEQFRWAKLESTRKPTEHVWNENTTRHENLPFHPLVDAWVRQIKEDILNQNLLSDPQISQAAANQRVHLTIAMRRILGRDLGLLAEGERYRDDPLQTDSILVAFNDLNVRRIVDWKPYLLQEFFFYYTPARVIEKFRDFANSWLAKDNIPRFNQLNGELFPAEDSADAFSWDEQTGQVTLTTEGARRILLGYQYLIDSKNN